MDDFRAIDELQLGERHDAVLVERGLEGEVEAGEGLDRRQARHHESHIDAAVLAYCEFFGQEKIDGFDCRRFPALDAAYRDVEGYRRFLATPGDDHFAINRAKAEEDAKFDGVFVLRTNADLSPLEAMLCYKQLWMVERAFRTSKSLFATRPIFHKLDETIRGHVSCSFLALVLKKELEDRIANIGKPAADSDATQSGSWPDILADLDSLTETEVEQDGKRFVLRAAPRPAASLALRAAGVALPPTVRQLADA